MFWDGNQECSNLCLVLAGVLSALHGLKSKFGNIGRIRKRGIAVFWTRLHGQGCVYTQGKRPQDTVLGVLPRRMKLSVEQLHSPPQLGAAGCSEVMLSGCGENPPG